MKGILNIFVIGLLLSSAFFAQKQDEVLATANGLTFTTSSLPAELRKAYTERKAAVVADRSQLCSAIIRDELIDLESKTSGIARDALLLEEVKKVADPTAAEIKTIYDANKAAFGSSTLDQVRPQIVSYLRGNAEVKAVNDLVERLKTKHKFAAGKDINLAGLKPTDVIFTIAGKPYTASEFDSRYKAHLYDAEAEIVIYTMQELDGVILSALIAQEAKARNMEPGDLIAAEVTNKLRDFTDEERAGAENALKKRLFEKYAVKVNIQEPEPVAHDVSPDDDPVFGKPSAPVTVVMFSDFQCSACAATHPLLKKVLAAYPDKARLVVRDFPLQSIHANAFQAALAAHAAQKQGKFYEYIDLLYQNQERLDAASLREYAGQVNLNLKQFELDLSDEKTTAEVRKDIADGIRHGARGTPTIFINGVRLHQLSAEALRSGIEKALARSASK